MRNVAITVLLDRFLQVGGHLGNGLPDDVDGVAAQTADEVVGVPVLGFLGEVIAEMAAAALLALDRRARVMHSETVRRFLRSREVCQPGL